MAESCKQFTSEGLQREGELVTVGTGADVQAATLTEATQVPTAGHTLRDLGEEAWRTGATAAAVQNVANLLARIRSIGQ